MLQTEESDQSIAKLNINKSLFEIEYDSLDVKRSVGKGGSNAVIFAAEWNGKEVAFKCFKINDLLSDNEFEEFEKEVSILASISHPNILRY